MAWVTLDDFVKKQDMESEPSTCSEPFLLLKMRKECVPLFEIIARELSLLCPNEPDRKLFYDISTGKSIREAASDHRISYRAACKKYEDIIAYLQSRQGVIADCQNKMQALFIQCRNYEAKIKAMALHENPVQRPQPLPAELPPEVSLLLSVSIHELFSRRIANALRQGGVYTLEDLLRLTKTNGFRILYRFHGLGNQSHRQVKKELLDKKIINDKEESYLYPYIVI